MMLKTSPSSQMMMNCRERESAEERRKFSMIWGEKTTTQQAIEMDLEEQGGQFYSYRWDHWISRIPANTRYCLDVEVEWPCRWSHGCCTVEELTADREEDGA